MGENYTPINTNPRKIVSSGTLDVELEGAREPEDKTKEIEIENEPPQEDPKGDLEVNLEESNKNDEPDNTKDEQPKSKPGRPKGSTNKKRDKRIKQLLDKTSAAEQRASELEAELEYFKKVQFESTKQANASRKENLEKTAEALKGQLKAALEDDDTEKAVEIQSKMMQAQVEYDSVTKELASTPEEYVPNKPAKKVEPSDYAKDWASDHPEFNSDPEFHYAALGANAKLINEGFDPDSEDFYTELDNRLSKRYPEYFDIDSESVVQSKGKASKSVDETENLEDDTSDDEYPQTVAGASRTPTSSSKSGRKRKNTVILSQEDQEICKQWGINPVDFAKRKKMLDEKGKGDYSPIQISKSQK